MSTAYSVKIIYGFPEPPWCYSEDSRKERLGSSQELWKWLVKKNLTRVEELVVGSCARPAKKFIGGVIYNLDDFINGDAAMRIPDSLAVALVEHGDLMAQVHEAARLLSVRDQAIIGFYLVGEAS